MINVTKPDKEAKSRRGATNYSKIETKKAYQDRSKGASIGPRLLSVHCKRQYEPTLMYMYWN